MDQQALETLNAEEELSGAEIIEDLCCQLAAVLNGDCNLRASDAYRSYSAIIKIDIQILNIGTTIIERTISVGNPDPDRPCREVEIQVPVTWPREVRERSGLPVPNLERVESAAPVVKVKRYHTPRQVRIVK